MTLPRLFSVQRLSNDSRCIIRVEKYSIWFESSCQRRGMRMKSCMDHAPVVSTRSSRKQQQVKQSSVDKIRPGMSLQKHQSPCVPVEPKMNSSWQGHLLGRGIFGLHPLNEGLQDDCDHSLTTFSKRTTISHPYNLATILKINPSVTHRSLAPIFDPFIKSLQIRKLTTRPAQRNHQHSRTLPLTAQLANTSLPPRSQKPYIRDVKPLNHTGATIPAPPLGHLNKQIGETRKKHTIRTVQARERPESNLSSSSDSPKLPGRAQMSSESPTTPAPETTSTETTPAQHKPLVVGLKKPQQSPNMASSDAAAAFNKEIAENVQENTASAAPAETPTEPQPKQKKEKAPKQPKAPKAAPAAAPTSPALIDLRVGHILRAIAHPNADSLYVSTIAMGDPQGTEHTQLDESTGQVVRTVCSGLKAYIPLSEMQDRKIIVVANLKPVNMRSIKSAAMVLAASPKQEEGADPHAPDRTVELVIPPEGSEAGDKVYFEGWPYGEGKGPEKVLNPKKKQWEAIQPGFFTGEDLKVGFDAGVCDEVEGKEKGDLVVEGKGVCTVKTLKGAVVR